MGKWLCSECGEIHDSNEVNYKCPNKSRNKYNRMTEEKKKIQKFYNSKRWKQFRHEILERDGFICQRCLSLYGLYNSEMLEVHHIQKIELHFEKRLEHENCITLCKTCHRQIDLSCDDGTLDFERVTEKKEKEFNFF